MVVRRVKCSILLRDQPFNLISNKFSTAPLTKVNRIPMRNTLPDVTLEETIPNLPQSVRGNESHLNFKCIDSVLGVANKSLQNVSFSQRPTYRDTHASASLQNIFESQATNRACSKRKTENLFEMPNLDQADDRAKRRRGTDSLATGNEFKESSSGSVRYDSVRVRRKLDKCERLLSKKARVSMRVFAEVDSEWTQIINEQAARLQQAMVDLSLQSAKEAEKEMHSTTDELLPLLKGSLGRL